MTAPDPITVTVTVDTNPPTTLGGDPSGGPGTLTPVTITPDPIEPGTEPNVTLEFQFTNPTGKTFTGFRWTHSYTEDGLSVAKYLGIWFQATGSPADRKWKVDDLFTVTFKGETMDVVDKNPSPHHYNYLYVVEWTEDGKTYVSDPKIMNQSGGGSDQRQCSKSSATRS